jgi:outer membrane protein assembly factor BamB
MGSSFRAAIAALFLVWGALGLRAGTDKIPQDSRFTDHGAPAPVSLARGATATLDGDGLRVLLVWQTDIGKLLSIDIETGAARQFAMPDFPPGGSGFAVLHSRRGLWYTHAGPWAKPGRLYEFDPKTMTFTFAGETKGTYVMSFHEDKDGTIWAALYPNAELVSFDPNTKKLTSHGLLNDESWPQYPRSGMARDKEGWIYVIIGFTKSQILAYHPKTSEKRKLLAEENRALTKDDPSGVGRIFLGKDGEVYGKTATKNGWKSFRLSKGKAFELAGEPKVEQISERTSSCWGVFLDFPDGSKIKDLDVPFRRLTVVEKDGTERLLRFDYEAPGTLMMNVFTGPKGEIYGSTAYPRFVFRFDSKTGKYFLHPDTNAGGHWNSWVTRSNSIYGAFYPWGMIREIDTTRRWTREEITKNEPGDYGKSVKSEPDICRPNVLILLKDGKRMLLGGTPGYGHTGGGLTIFDAETGKSETISHDKLIPSQSTVALANLADGKVLGTTWLEGGTGGKAGTGIPQLYIFDPDTKEMVWTANCPEIEGKAQPLREIVDGGDGLLYLLNVKASKLYAFDQNKREIFHRADLDTYGTVAPAAGMGVMQKDTDGQLYILFEKALVRYNPATGKHEKLADIPVENVRGQLALTPDRIYFGAGFRLWSYKR